MNDREKHVNWIIGESHRRGYHEFAGAIEGVLEKEGFEAAFKYIQINAEVQKMLFLDRGNMSS